MKDLLLFITKSIVDNPDEVKVEEMTDDSGSAELEISVDPQDIGRVIGKEGKMINSIRSIMRVAARKQGKRVRVMLQEPRDEEQSLENQE